MLGLYVHIPFCSAIGNYCNFNRGLFDAALKERYVTALLSEIRRSADPSTALGAGGVRFDPVPGSEFDIPADLVLLAMGFVGPERGPLVNDLGVRFTERGNVWRDEHWMTSVPGVFTAGDMQRGQSLIVWAIAEGRSAARGIDQYLMGQSTLPAPLS